MSELVFEWDSEKNRESERKHGVTFEEARTVFYDENARLIMDPDHSLEEDRFILLGLSDHGRILTVCHCYRQGETRIRIISARKAVKKERKQYEERIS